MPDEQFAPAEREFGDHGFGYSDYGLPETFTEQKAYGISLAKPSYVVALLERDETIRLRSVIERGWILHQDVITFQKLPIGTEELTCSSGIRLR